MSLHQKQYREPPTLELDVTRLRRYVEHLRTALTEMVDKGEGCAACGTRGLANCGCIYERARVALETTSNLYFSP